MSIIFFLFAHARNKQNLIESDSKTEDFDSAQNLVLYKTKDEVAKKQRKKNAHKQYLI